MPQFPRSKQRQTLYRALVAAFAVVFIAGVVWRWWSSGTGTPVPVLAEVSRGDVEAVITAIGSLQPRDYVDVGAQVSGELQRIHVAIGDTVKKGDLLADIDPRVLLARVEVDRASLLGLKARQDEAEAHLELARQQFQRQENLLRDEATSKDAYQISKAALRSAEATVKTLAAEVLQAESNLKANETTLGYTRIYAPMDGTIMSLQARQGQTLNANQQAPIILRIGDLSTMTVWTQVSEADVAQLKPGMPAYFTTLGSGKQRWTGRLQQILPTPEILNNVVLYTALFDADNRDQQLLPQMTAQVFFVQDAARDAVLVPLSALTPLDGHRGAHEVTVQTADGQLVVRTVDVGVSNRVMAEVRSGLSPGEWVVTGYRQAGTGAATEGTGTRPGGQPRMQLGSGR